MCTECSIFFQQMQNGARTLLAKLNYCTVCVYTIANKLFTVLKGTKNHADNLLSKPQSANTACYIQLRNGIRGVPRILYSTGLQGLESTCIITVTTYYGKLNSCVTINVLIIMMNTLF